MKNLIAKLQDEPLEVRKQILMITTLGITVVVVLIWILTLTLGAHPKSVSVKSDSTTKPFLLLKNNIVQVYANAQKGFEEAKSSLDNNK